MSALRADEIRNRLDDLQETADWVPFLPLRFAPDVTAARQAIADGVVGSVSDVDVVSYFGALPDRGWEDDEARPRSSFEAAVWVVDLAEHLLGAPVESTRWLKPAALAVHDFETTGGPLLTARHVPIDRGVGTAVSANVIGEHGQLLLRQPFAPGGLAIWHGKTREMTVPALPKPNPRGASVSTPGGWEAHALKDVDPVTGQDLRSAVLRMVRHLKESQT